LKAVGVFRLVAYINIYMFVSYFLFIFLLFYLLLT